MPAIYSRRARTNRIRNSIIRHRVHRREDRENIIQDPAQNGVNYMPDNNFFSPRSERDMIEHTVNDVFNGGMLGALFGLIFLSQLPKDTQKEISINNALLLIGFCASAGIILGSIKAFVTSQEEPRQSPSILPR